MISLLFCLLVLAYVLTKNRKVIDWQKESGLRNKFVLSLIIIISLLFLFGGVLGTINTFNAKYNWSKVDAKVEKVEISETCRYQIIAEFNCIKDFAPVVTYSFDISGKHYKSNSTSIKELDFSSHEQADAWLADKKQGDIIPIYYDPSNPQGNSTIDNNIDYYLFLYVMIPLIIIFLTSRQFLSIRKSKVAPR